MTHSSISGAALWLDQIIFWMLEGLKVVTQRVVCEVIWWFSKWRLKHLPTIRSQLSAFKYLNRKTFTHLKMGTPKHHMSPKQVLIYCLAVQPATLLFLFTLMPLIALLATIRN